MKRNESNKTLATTATKAPVFERLQQRFRRSRSGSVLIMVVALLVLLALMGTAYLATARQDRVAAGQIRATGIDEIARQAASDALAAAGTWLANDTQTFTTVAGGDPAAQLSGPSAVAPFNTLAGPLVAPRTPDLAPLAGPFAFPPALNPNSYAVRWKRITTPPDYGRFASPIPSPVNNVNAGNNFSINPQFYYDFNDNQDWPVPTSMTLSYPTNYGGTLSLRGQTRTFPAFQKFTWDQASGKVLVSGPYIAADTTGAGIADAALVPLDLASTDGIQWFAAWRIVDNAAALNLNTAWGPNPYPAGAGMTNALGGNANQDPNGNSFNFFPSDVDLYGFLNSSFNATNVNTTSEMAALQMRRVPPNVATATNSDTGACYTTFLSDNPVVGGAPMAHTDVAYLYRGEAMWWNLGRRADNPINGVAGDWQDGYRRPFTDADTVALGLHGVMTDPASAQSKIEQVFSAIQTPGGSGDSVYRGAMNYMLNTQDRFSVLPANAIAYWYDWNFNFEGFAGAGSGSVTPGKMIFSQEILGNGGTASSSPIDTLSIGNKLGNNNPSAPPPWTTGDPTSAAGNAWLQAAFRTPRSLLAGDSPVLNVARYVDPTDWPDVSRQPVAGNVAPPSPAPTFFTTPIPLDGMSTFAATTLSRKVSLNTGEFPALWRAFGNVFSDFRNEDGSTALADGSLKGTYHLHLFRDLFGYDLRDSAGRNGTTPNVTTTIDASNPFMNPRQVRNPFRDPGKDDSASTGTVSATNNGDPKVWLDAVNTAALRAAIAAVNVLTMRDQHGQMLNGYFSPYVSKRAIQLNVHTAPSATQPSWPTTQPVTAFVYGSAPQPYISEVYVSTDTHDYDSDAPSSPDSTGVNPNGLVVIKLYNPYPFDISLQGYDLAVADRKGSFGAGIGSNPVGTPAGAHMKITLVSRPVDPNPVYNQPGGLFHNPNGFVSIPANSFLYITNYDHTRSTHWPKYGTGFPTPAPTVPDPTPAGQPVKYVVVPGLSDVIGGATPADGAASPLTAEGGELVLLRPLSPNPGSAVGAPMNGRGTGFLAPATNLPEVPVDSFDFSGLKLDNGAGGAGAAVDYYAWHYLRTTPTPPLAVGGQPTQLQWAWKFIYPGVYSGSGTFGAAANPKRPLPTGAAAGDPSYSGPKPHFIDMEVEQWTMGGTQPTKEPWDQDMAHTNPLSPIDNAGPAPGAAAGQPSWFFDPAVTAPTAGTYVNPFPGIQVFNLNSGGFNKRDPAAPSAPVQFPYGGFARVGDVQQVPFVGSYVIFGDNAATPLWPPQLPGAANPQASIAEINPVTVDTCYVDDGDNTDDAYEQVGRFVPLVDPNNALVTPPGIATTAINDLAPYGAYSLTAQTPGPYNMPSGLAPDLAPNNSGAAGQAVTNVPTWRYHFALEVFNQFTVISSPGEDRFPNFNLDSWYQAVPNNNVNPPPANTPTLVQNATSSGVEGMINVNTADWRTLAAVEMIPRSKDKQGLTGFPDGAFNTALAKAIVYYRDVDDGLLHEKLAWDPATGRWVTTNPVGTYRRGHGPFNSLAELNNVWADPTHGFQNGMGTIAAGMVKDSTAVSTTTTRQQFGYYLPLPPGSVASTVGYDNLLQKDDWVGQNLMVERVSNLLTTRSDSFTVYVVVQGWRNAFVSPGDPKLPNGPWPELVIQRRMAMTVDRSGVTPTSKTVRTTAFPTK